MSASANGGGHGLSRAIRPLLWWLLLVLVLFLMHRHQVLSERTHLAFSAYMEGHPYERASSGMLDGHEFNSGDRIPIGWHTLSLAIPKAESLSTNLFIWYGWHDLGQIPLKRAMGTLAIQANPPAWLITIAGPEYSTTLTNTPGITVSVPTDDYTVSVQYTHWDDAQTLTVAPNDTVRRTFDPHFGTLQLSCNRSNASFQLFVGNDRFIEGGEFPDMIPDLPEGSYQLVARHHDNRLDKTIQVIRGVTNDAEIDFRYGTAVLKTEPSGASVASEDREWGTTPLILSELFPGNHQFTFRRNGYEPVTVNMEVTANEITAVTTNLVNINYKNTMASARAHFAAGNYDRVLDTLNDLPAENANNAEVIALRNGASGQNHLRRGVELGKRGDYISGVTELEFAVQLLPDNDQAKQLLTDFKTQVPEQIERQRLERLERPKKLLDQVVARTPDANLFESHELTTGKPVKEVEAAIVKSLGGLFYSYKITQEINPSPETFVLQAETLFIGGTRHCIIVGGQTTDNETKIYFVVLEYKTHHRITFEGGLTDWEEHIPIHPSRIEMTDKLKAQIQEGVTNVAERIQNAVSQGNGGNK